MDYIQNQQINSNQQHWNTLHGAVNRINDLQRVVINTNNESHNLLKTVDNHINRADWLLDSMGVKILLLEEKLSDAIKRISALESES